MIFHIDNLAPKVNIVNIIKIPKLLHRFITIPITNVGGTIWKKNLSPLIVGVYNGANTMKISMQIPQELELEISLYPCIPLPGNVQEELKNHTTVIYVHPLLLHNLYG